MPGAAAVGVNETTREVKAYPHPENEYFVLSDLPGVGTPNFPQKDYLRKVGFKKFDIFLIICSGRFTENDLWLANQVKKQKKTFYFIRTKIDVDIINDKEDHSYPTEQEEEQERALVEKVASDCQLKLAKDDLRAEIFVISGRPENVDRWDFPALREKLIGTIPTLEREPRSDSSSTTSDKKFIKAQEMMDKEGTLDLKKDMHLDSSSSMSEEEIMEAQEMMDKEGTLDMKKNMHLDSSSFMSEDEIKKAQEALDKEGIGGLKKHLVPRLNAWKNMPLSIGVTGKSGSGKSTFINTMRGLGPKMPGAAEVDVTETTSEVKAYPHPGHENFVLYDLPGVGTPKFPQKDYLKKIEFEKIDFFLLICSVRFTENDLWLANQVKKQKKSFYFIRSKIDIDIDNYQKDHPEEKREEIEKTVLDKVAKECLVQLTKSGFETETPIFLIGGKLRCIHQWHFPRLQDELIKNIPKLKREALTLSLQCNSMKIADKKIEALKARIWIVATISAAGGAIPLPGLSIPIDTVLITHEVMEYKRQLGLDRNTLEELAKSHQIDVERLAKIVGFSDIPKAIASGASVGVLLVGRGLIKGFVPVVGSVIGAGVSYASTSAVLRSILSKLRKAVLQIIEEVIIAESDSNTGAHHSAE